MFKNKWLYGITGFCACGGAIADVSLINRDGKSHEITLKCSSTSHTSIGANSTRGLGKGPCTVTLKGSNASATGSGNQKIVIKNGAVGIE